MKYLSRKEKRAIKAERKAKQAATFSSQIYQIVRNGQFIKGKSATKAPGKKFAKFEHNKQYESGMMLERSPWRTGPTFIRKDTV